MRVRIVCGEPVHQWILGKFALKLELHLKEKGIDADIGMQPDVNADVNHYIIYLQYKGVETKGINTLMVTHIDDSAKLSLLKNQLQTAEMGICMSGDTRDFLISGGLPADRLSYISPAHDGAITPRKKIIGMATRLYPDGRKREYLLKDVISKIDNSLFAFTIIGEGWEEYINLIKEKKFEVNYYPAFEYELYNKLMPTIDYYLYMGMDEGQMGCIDALAAGAEVIATHQGYHLDMLPGVKYTFKTQGELVAIFQSIQQELMLKSEAIQYWTWPFYTNKHLELWKFLIANKGGVPFKLETSIYKDGVFSVKTTLTEGSVQQLSLEKKINLIINTFKHNYANKKDRIFSLLKTIGFKKTIFYICKKLKETI